MLHGPATPQLVGQALLHACGLQLPLLLQLPDAVPPWLLRMLLARPFAEAVGQVRTRSPEWPCGCLPAHTQCIGAWHTSYCRGTSRSATSTLRSWCM